MPRLTTAALRAKYLNGDERIVMLTAYDYPTARVADRSGIDVILVGDSVGTTVLGYSSVAEVTLADMVHHTAAVSRGTKRSFVLADLPAGTVDSPEAALSAAKALVAAGADGVKIEVDAPHRAEAIRAVVNAGIPVCGHVGYTPQSEGLAPSAQGKTIERALEIVSLAMATQEAGACMLVLELIPEELSEHISLTVNIPTIGIGAGRFCTGQVQVFHDIAGISDTTFKHAKRFGDLDTAMQNAVVGYLRDVSTKKFPTHENASHIDDELKTAIVNRTMELLSA